MMIKGFDTLVGYRKEKEKLRRIVDILREPERYAEKGVQLPRGVMLSGDHGSGKTAMAYALMAESGRECFACTDGEILDAFSEACDTAKENGPTILFLDDIDREDDSFYKKLCTCFDRLEQDVLILAAAKDANDLPGYLKDIHRFGWSVDLSAPRDEEVREAVDFFLKNIPCDPQLDRNAIADLLASCEYGEIESVLNAAGLCCFSESAKQLTMKHIVRGFISMMTLYPEHEYHKNEDFRQTARHEAGHAVVSEVLHPGLVTLVLAREKSGETYYCPNNQPTREANIVSDIRRLGGRAAIELQYGVADSGATSDLQRAFRRAWYTVTDHCAYGFWKGHAEGCGDESDLLKTKREYEVATEVEENYKKAKRILELNQDFLDKVTCALIERETLTAADIRAIRESCTITPVDVYQTRKASYFPLQR